MPFYDRKEAGQKLSQAIKSQVSNLKPQDSVILALPRGGVIVGKEVAKVLRIPLDILVVRKIGYPQNPEYAIGAVGESSQVVLSEEGQRIDSDYLQNEIKKEKDEIKRRLKEYRGDREGPDFKDKLVILVDDGLATGLTMKAAIKEVGAQNPEKIVVAVPVAPPETIKDIKKEVDQIVCLETPSPFMAIGNFYERFEQITDQEVKKALKQKEKTRKKIRTLVF